MEFNIEKVTGQRRLVPLYKFRKWSECLYQSLLWLFKNFAAPSCSRLVVFRHIFDEAVSHSYI